ncbi:hypothetical protein EV401DRAFT_2083057 [Pisolithus croceorrhizus]|nr:hypothetical protein EV401DRAFT_2083057 [Pisolithus croceorrhizus]
MLLPSPTCHSGELEQQYAFMVALMVYLNLKSKMKGKASTLKEVKSMKIKELSFPLKDDNYLGFLQAVLNKHGKDHYKVLEKKCYLFKYVPPKTKGQCVGDVMDIDNEADYQEMVGKVSSIQPSTTKIFIDMKQVKRLPTGESGDKSSESSNVANNLKPHLMEVPIWTHALPGGASNFNDCTRMSTMKEEGQATLDTPPNIESFNMMNRATYLHPTCKAQAPMYPPTPTTPSVDFNLLALVLLLQTLTKSSMLHSPTSVTPCISLTSSPVMPTQQVLDLDPFYLPLTT